MAKFFPVLMPGAAPDSDRILEWLRRLPRTYAMGEHDTEAIWSTIQEIEELRAACRAALEVGEALDNPADGNQRIYLGKKTVETLRKALGDSMGQT